MFFFFESVKFEILSVLLTERELRGWFCGGEERRFIRGRGEKKVQGVVGIKK